MQDANLASESLAATSVQIDIKKLSNWDCVVKSRLSCSCTSNYASCNVVIVGLFSDKSCRISSRIRQISCHQTCEICFHSFGDCITSEFCFAGEPVTEVGGEEMMMVLKLPQ